MSKCEPEEGEMFPPAGIPDYPLEHDYPTRFTNFHWWGQPVDERVCYKSIRRDEIPIPPIQDERRRFPYRYSSAGPATSGMTGKERERLIEIESKKPRRKIKLGPRDILQVKGYETMSMDASLQPYLYRPPTEIATTHTPKNLLLRTWAPRCAHSDFGTYVLSELHPNYKKDPLIRKRIQFSSADSNRELCVTLKELEHLDPKPQKKIKKKDFLFVQQRPGHRPSTESMEPACSACD